MTSRFPWIVLILVFIIYPALATTFEEYELLLAEVSLLIQYTMPTDESFALIDSAKSAASQNDYESAVVYLEVAITDLNENHLVINDEPELNENESTDDIKFKIISGLDFNRQEFEVGYIETDSVILSEVNKPFIGLNLDYTIAGSRQHGLGSYLYLRVDHENIEGRIKLTNPYKKSRLYGYNSLEFNYDNNRENQDIGYWEIADRQSLNYTLDSWYFQLQNYSRYKHYKQPSQSVPRFFKNITSVSALYEYNLLKNIRLFYQADLNNSINEQNNDYFEHLGEIGFVNWIPGPVSNEFTGNFIYNDFTYALDDSIINNISKTITAKMHIRAPLFFKLYWNFDYNYKYKFYKIESEQDPNYFDHELDTSFQKDFIRNLTIGLGYHYQKRENRVSAGSNEIYIKEQNFHDDGILAELNYHNSNSMLFTGTVTYSKRVYPESENVELISFYKSKYVLNLFILFQMPIYRNLSANVFLCYDGDKELDNDKNDTRSIIFSAELEYNF